MTQPPLPGTSSVALDFYGLRREGVGLIERMGSRLWTDYNPHDPGITILEAFIYAITDLAYRAQLPIADLLAPATPHDPQDPFPKQSFFTARRILTVNPTTPDDFRRLLIDLQQVRNAWLLCNACSVGYYAWCEVNKLVLAYEPPAKADTPSQVVHPRGLYDVLLELESDARLGDLNEPRIEQRFDVLDDEGRQHAVTLELRFPDWRRGRPDEWQTFLDADNGLAGVTVQKFSRSPTEAAALSDADLRRFWTELFYIDYELELAGGETIKVESATLRLFGDSIARGLATVAQVQTLLGSTSASGFARRYRDKMIKIDAVERDALAHLQAHRNLDEDYARVRRVEIENVAVCAQIAVTPDADIERVQAEIWFRIAAYFNPSIRFYSLQELLGAGVPVEDIFNGPELSGGFLKAEDLRATGLKTQLRTSDIVNLLMDIQSVVAVNDVLLTKYDAMGAPVRGAADPVWYDGTPVFAPDKESAAWMLFISSLHQPRLHRNLSCFHFQKQGLPFLPRLDEAEDILIALQGEADRPKIEGATQDLLPPAGVYRSPSDYYPVQYSFPLTYGIGPAGLRSTATVAREAQAKQLKAYLLVFEQLLANAFEQVAHAADLFSLDPGVEHSYFGHLFDEAAIVGHAGLVNGLTADALQGLLESEPEFYERRNRFLDHLLAQFGEQFAEYALLLTGLEGGPVAQQTLIHDKISFLEAYPRISHDRGKAFDYTRLCSPANVSGLQERVSLLLGYPALSFSWQAVSAPAPPGYRQTFALKDLDDVDWLSFEPQPDVTAALEALITAAGLDAGTVGWQFTYADGELSLRAGSAAEPDNLQPSSLPQAEASTVMDAIVAAMRTALQRMTRSSSYDVVPSGTSYTLELKDADGNILGTADFDTQSAAEARRGELRTWSGNARAMVVEHLLLRPKFPGDALYPACTDGPCTDCGCEDPCSFRLTYVMPGWTAPYSTEMAMRRFADRVIQQETPSHLVVKACWVGNDGFEADACDPLVEELAALLESKGKTAANASLTHEEACACGTAIYEAVAKVFVEWYEDKTLEVFNPYALEAAIKAEFANVDKTAIGCVAVLDDALWVEVLAAAVAFFKQVVLEGWQFERLEDAWCHWLQVNAGFDWTKELLREDVEAILAAHLTDLPFTKEDRDELCRLAADLLAQFGTQFFTWIDGNVTAGNDFADFTPFTPAPLTLTSILSFGAGTAQDVGTFLAGRYGNYAEVSYRLRVVVDLLSGLSNTYPAGTLHDYDDGSDINPIRLGQTHLGRNRHGNGPD